MRECNAGAFVISLYIPYAGKEPDYSTFDFRQRKWPPLFLHVLP